MFQPDKIGAFPAWSHIMCSWVAILDSVNVPANVSVDSRARQSPACSEAGGRFARPPSDVVVR